MQLTDKSPNTDFLEYLKYKDEAINEIQRLDAKGKIDLSYLPNGLHYNRIIELCIKQRQSGESKKEVYKPNNIQRMINSRGYNWTRPDNTPALDSIIPEQFMSYSGIRLDSKPITRKEREELLNLPLDTLGVLIAQRLLALANSKYYPTVKLLNQRQFNYFNARIVEHFTAPIYEECFWEPLLIENMALVVFEGMK